MIFKRFLPQQLRVLASPFGLALLLGLLLPIGCLLWFMLRAAEAERIAAERRLKTLLTKDIHQTVNRWHEQHWQSLETLNADVNPQALFALGTQSPLIHAIIITDLNGQIVYPVAKPTRTTLPEAFIQSIRTFRQYAAHDNDLAINTLERFRESEHYANATSAHQIVIDFLLFEHLQQRVKNNTAANVYEPLITQLADRLSIRLNHTQDDQLHPRTRLMYAKKLVVLSKTYQPSAFVNTLGSSFDFIESINSNNINDLHFDKHPDWVIINPNQRPQIDSALENKLTLWLIKSRKQLSKTLTNIINEQLQGSWVTAEIAGTPSLNPKAAYHRQLQSIRATHLNIYWQDPQAFSQTLSRQSIIYFSLGFSVIIFLCVSAAYVFHHIRKEKQLSELKAHAISTVAHELKTPLTSIRLLLDNLSQNASDPETIKDYAKIMQREHNRLSTLVENFLTFNRLERNQSSLTTELMDIHTLLDDALSILAGTLKQQAIELNYTKEDNKREGRYFVCVDRNLMTTCLLNLIDNACKYAATPKQVGISIEYTQETIKITISDNGPGIALSERQKIFEPYYRAESALSRSSEGTGLGLYIAKAIAQLHAGNIDWQPARPCGSRFILQLPRHHLNSNI